MYDYYLFDLDGTLTDPGIGITNSVMHALRKYGIEVSDRKTLYPFIGPPLVQSFEMFCGFSKEKALQAVEYYREYFRVTGLFENEVYDGIADVLQELLKRNVKMAVATSKPEEFTLRILEHFSLLEYFDFVGGATLDGSRGKKADIIAYVIEQMAISDLSRVVMIGDRKYDIEGAKANGIKSAGVLYGYGDRQEIEEAGADHILSGPMEILQL